MEELLPNPAWINYLVHVDGFQFADSASFYESKHEVVCSTTIMSMTMMEKLEIVIDSGLVQVQQGNHIYF